MDVGAHGHLRDARGSGDLGVLEVLVEPQHDGRPLLRAAGPLHTRHTASAVASAVGVVRPARRPHLGDRRLAASVRRQPTRAR